MFPDESAQTGDSTFLVAETFDVGGAAIVVVRVTLTATVPDGETFGTAGTDVAVEPTYERSADGILWTSQAALMTDYHGDSNNTLSVVNQYIEAIFPIPAQGRVTATLILQSSGDPYAGANHPRATLRFSYAVLAGPATVD